jgi:NADPH:quinone reductase-like Zn-dependent oxidoreductase
VDSTRLARVRRFGPPDILTVAERRLAPLARGRIRVRVTHASVGSTDVLARAGGYLLQPVPGFTPGYDLVGEIVEGGDDRMPELVPGARVAACLARMGSNTQWIDLRPERLVTVPDSLDSATAAALPLDLMTATMALRMAHPLPGSSVLIQGVAGNVGRILAQRAGGLGLRVLGTASARNRGVAESLGAAFLDYADAGWHERLLDLVPGGVDTIVDHTGDRSLRSLVAHGGIIVRTSFTGRRGRERVDTIRGSVLAALPIRPREQVCSVPFLVARRPLAFRRLLRSGLSDVARGAIVAPHVTVVPFEDVASAHRLVEAGTPMKVVLAF